MEIVKDINNESYQSFVEINIVRSLSLIKKEISENKIVSFNTPYIPNKFIDYAIEYEKRYERDFKNSEYKARYGILLNILLPKKEFDINKIKKIIRMYTRMIIQNETGLKHIAWTYKKGSANMLKIYIYDREVSNKKLARRYKRDIYVNKLNNKICSKNDDFAVMIAKKGDLIKDKNNEEKKEYIKSTKTRIFIYKNGEFETFRKRFMDCYHQTLIKMQYKIKDGFIIRRKNLNKAFNRFQRRIIIKVNQLIQYIQNEINKYYDFSLKNIDSYDAYRYQVLPGEKLETNKSKNVIKILEEYRKIIAAEVFYINDIEYKLNGYRCDLVEFNCDLLKEKFDKDIRSLAYEK